MESIAFASEYGLEYAENAFAARVLPQTPLGELTTLPRSPSRLEKGHPSPGHTPLGASTAGSAPVHIISGYTTVSAVRVCLVTKLVLIALYCKLSLLTLIHIFTW